jgi:hypothetical protein
MKLCATPSIIHVNLLSRFGQMLLAAAVATALARPETPHQRHYRQDFQEFPPGPFPARQQVPRQAPQPGPPHSAYGPPSLPPIVTRNVYVHLPPEDPEDNRPQQVIPQTPPKKHYKLIFIKAPEPPRYRAPVIPQQQLDEHKTLVYVLVKRPDEQQQVDIPQIVPTEPSKPEVFFIKYKAQQEAPQAPYPAAGGPVAGPPLPQFPGPPLPPAYGPPPPSVDFGPVNY